MRVRLAATDADRLAVMEVWHAATERDEPLAYHQALRLPILRRHQGGWWLGEEDGQVVSSLMCYPLRFADGDEVVDGYGLGAVATRPEARRRGHAATLCRAAVAEAEADGRRIGLLFSAIDPTYYERLGFRVAPAWRHVGDAGAIAASGAHADLVPLDPRREVEMLLRHYREAHPGLHVHRDADEWQAALVRNAGDLFFGVGAPRRGYVRVNPEEASVLEIVELTVPSSDRAPAVRAVAALAAAMGRREVEGWFDPVPELASLLEDRRRHATRPMLRGTDAVDAARFWGSDYF